MDRSYDLNSRQDVLLDGHFVKRSYWGLPNSLSLRVTEDSPWNNAASHVCLTKAVYPG